VSTSAARAALALLIGFVSTAGSVTAEVRPVKAGGDFQAALNAAQPGDDIVLEAGATFTGGFVLPRKAAGAPITIRSSAALPDRRVGPNDAALMPKIRSGSADPAIHGPCARNWKLDGIEFQSTAGGLYNIIYTENVRNPDGTFCNADNITFDRLLIIAGPDGQRRAIAGNGGHITLTRSHIANIRYRGDETAAFGAWDGPGPYTIRDNYLEAAGMSILFGGADSSSPNHIPSDILVEGNHMTKRLEWKGQGYAIKNNFELKSARRVVVRNNLLERSWTDAQVGYSVVITVHNDGGGSPWACIEDVSFDSNIVRDAERGINILGTGYVYPSGQLRRLTIRNNLVVSGQGFQIGGEAAEVTIDHNTFVNNGGLGVLYKGGVWRNGEPAVREGRFAVQQLTFTNNLAYHNESGLFGDAVGSGLPALTAHTSNYTWTNNVLANRIGGYTYPPITWHPTAAEHQAEFNPDHTLTATSKYRKAASDKSDLGWNGSNPLLPRPATPQNVRIRR
jgi:hypothetical protein